MWKYVGIRCRTSNVLHGLSMTRAAEGSRWPFVVMRQARPFHSQIKQDNILDTLRERGMLHQVTAPNSLQKHLGEGGERSIYVGVDPSADSLHVGNLLPLMAMLHFVQHGHRAVIVVGGATGSIGDPSGRSAERQALSADVLRHNVEKITKQIHGFFQNASAFLFESSSTEDLSSKVTVVNNADWYTDLNILAFLRDVGKLARISSMLARDSVKSRLQPTSVTSAPAGLSFTEFSYQLLQAYDFSVLHQAPWHCTVQLGGSDQMGNIMAGVDLIRRQRAANPAEVKETDDITDEQMPAYGLTLPLLTTASGAKFGKSAGNAVWLEESKCSHYDFYQYFYRARDDEVEVYLKTLTMLPSTAIDAMMATHKQDPSKRQAQYLLANHVTELIRGREALEQAQIATQVLFSTNLTGLTTEKVTAAFRNDSRLHSVKMEDVLRLDVPSMVAQVGLTKSKGEAKRVITNKGIYLNGQVVDSIHATFTPDDVLAGTKLMMLRRGKNEHSIIVIEE